MLQVTLANMTHNVLASKVPRRTPFPFAIDLYKFIQLLDIVHIFEVAGYILARDRSSADTLITPETKCPRA